MNDNLPKNQREFIAYFNKNNKLHMNPDLFKRSDKDIIEELKKVILSCERNNKYFSIKVLNFEVVDSYKEVQQILFDAYEQATKNKSKFKKKDNPYAGINLNESDIKLLLVDYHVKVMKTTNQINHKTGKPIPTEETFRVIIAVPRIVDRYYIKINGIMRSTLYQIVDGSTYNNSNTNSKVPNISFKIVFMAVRVFRYFLELEDIHGRSVRLTQYMSNIFNKTVPGFKYILAKFGFAGAMHFCGLNNIYITEEPIEDEEFFCFKKADNLYISAPVYLVDNDLVTQAFISAVYVSLIPDMPFHQIFGDKFWCRSLGGSFNGTSEDKMLAIMNGNDSTITDTYDKGMSILDSFETIYDISTKESIRLPEDQKATMYHILRWILREFNALRRKNNLDVSIKKIRFAEYIASIYAIKIAKGIYRVADKNSKITTSDIRKAIRTDPMFLLNSISKSNLVSYRNMVSDMDSIVALKFTYKGIAGLGEGSDKSIPDITRYIHPSHLGRLDLDASSDGNPGITGTISPFTKMYDTYFSDYQEPNTWEERYHEVYENYRKVSGLRQAIIFKDALGVDVPEEQRVVTDDLAASMKQIINIATSGYSDEFLDPLCIQEPVDDELDVLRLLQGGL